MFETALLVASLVALFPPLLLSKDLPKAVKETLNKFSDFHNNSG
jgi:hypothetical protein